MSPASAQAQIQPVAQPRPIGQLLLARGLVNQAQIDEALAHQQRFGKNKLLGELLVDLGFVTQDQIAEVVAEAHGAPYVKLTPRLTDPRIVEILPRPFIEKHRVLPMFHVAGLLTVAVAEPSNVFLIEEIERQAGCAVQIVCCTAADIDQTIKAQFRGADVFVIEQLADDLNAGDISVVDRQPTELVNLEEVAGQSPVVKLVNYLISSAVQDAASDIHIEPDENRLRVRYRVDGRLFEKIRPPYAMHAAIASRIKIMAGMDISERRVPQDGGIHVMLDGRPLDLRVSTMPGKCGEKVVVRIIDNSRISPSLERLGFGDAMLRALKHALTAPHGFVLVTGPTGSGKSTTLYAMLAEMNRQDINICTVEDPIEYNLMGVNQFQVNEKAGFTFAGALRSLLRQDPDVLMVGEVRDAETARLATQASLTGHRVLSTLHTNDAPSAVTRLVNIGVEPFLIAASMRAVLAQRLVRKVCMNCRRPVEAPATLGEQVQQMVGPVAHFYHGVGCEKCRQTGYSGRIGIFELLVIGDELMELITQNAPLNELRRAAESAGFRTLRHDGMEKVKAGLTTVDEVLYETAG